MEEWRTIKDWPDYEVSNEGRVRKRSNGSLLAEWHGKVRLAKSRSCRSWRNVAKLIEEVFKNTYVAPVARDLSEPGEEWKRIEFANDYMVSSHKRVWSWKTLKFVGKLNGNGKMEVLFTIGGKQRTVGIDKLYAEAFGYNIPTIEGEQWRESVSPGIWVSSLGRLFSTWHLRLISSHKNPKGYLTIRGRDKHWKVHRLVAMAFIPNPDPGRLIEVDHINEDKNDNRAENLRWCTKEENLYFYQRNHPELRKAPISPFNLSGLTR